MLFGMYTDFVFPSSFLTVLCSYEVSVGSQIPITERCWCWELSSSELMNIIIIVW